MFQYILKCFIAGGELTTIEDLLPSTHDYQLLTLATSQCVITGNLMCQEYFEVLYSLLEQDNL